MASRRPAPGSGAPGVCHSDRVQVEMTLPVMEPDLWSEGAATLEAGPRAVDSGPFTSLWSGERMVSDNPETLTVLGAVAARTTRVRLVTTVVVPQLHDPVLPTTGFAGPLEELRGVLKRLENVGADEVHLIPTSSDAVGSLL